MMRGPLIETSARAILNQGINQAQREIALRMLKRGKMTIEEIAEDTGLSTTEVEQLAGLLNQDINQARREMALRMLQDKELSIDKIAEYSGLKVEDVEQLAGLQTV